MNPYDTTGNDVKLTKALELLERIAKALEVIADNGRPR
jgi:hypothetical protein